MTTVGIAIIVVLWLAAGLYARVLSPSNGLLSLLLGPLALNRALAQREHATSPQLPAEPPSRDTIQEVESLGSLGPDLDPVERYLPEVEQEAADVAHHPVHADTQGTPAHSLVHEPEMSPYTSFSDFSPPAEEPVPELTHDAHVSEEAPAAQHEKPIAPVVDEPSAAEAHQGMPAAPTFDTPVVAAGDGRHPMTVFEEITYPDTCPSCQRALRLDYDKNCMFCGASVIEVPAS